MGHCRGTGARGDLMLWKVVPSKSEGRATDTPPSALPSMGDISSHALPSMTQLTWHHQVTWWWSLQWCSLLHFVTHQTFSAHTVSLNLVPIITLSWSPCPFFPDKEAGSEGHTIPHGVPGTEREPRGKRESVVDPKGHGHQQDLNTALPAQPKGLAWELSATFSP